jgi:hypothetical protein
MSGHGVFDPEDSVFVRKTEMLVLLRAFEFMAARPERCQGLPDILYELKKIGILDTYNALKVACAREE